MLGSRVESDESVENVESYEEGMEPYNESVWSDEKERAERDKTTKRPKYKRMKGKKKGKKRQVKCTGSITSSCDNGICSVKCGDRKQVGTLLV